MTVAMTTALGSAPRISDIDTAIGTISAVVAVFDIKFVSTQDTTKMTNSNIIGLGFFQGSYDRVRDQVPAPEVSSALARRQGTTEEEDNF